MPPRNDFLNFLADFINLRMIEEESRVMHQQPRTHLRQDESSQGEEEEGTSSYTSIAMLFVAWL